MGVSDEVDIQMVNRRTLSDHCSVVFVLGRSLDSLSRSRGGARVHDVFAIYEDLIVFADVGVEEGEILERNLRRSDAAVHRLYV